MSTERYVKQRVEYLLPENQNNNNVKLKVKSLSRVWLFAAPWTVASQAPLSMGILQVQKLESVAISFSSIYTTMYKTDNNENLSTRSSTQCSVVT